MSRIFGAIALLSALLMLVGIYKKHRDRKLMEHLKGKVIFEKQRQ